MPSLRRIVLIIVFVTVGLVTLYNLYFYGKMFPNTFISGVDISGKSLESASYDLSEIIKPPEKLTLVSGDEVFEISTQSIDLKYDIPSSVQRAYQTLRTGNILLDLYNRIYINFNARDFGLSFTLNEEELAKFIAVVNGKVSIDPIYPSAKIVKGNVLIEKGKAGNKINTDLLRAHIGKAIAFREQGPIQIPVTPVDPSLSEDQITLYKDRIEKLVGKSISVNFEFDTFRITDSDLIVLIDPKGEFNNEELIIQKDKIAGSINRDPQNPKFNFQNGKVSEFQPAKDGVVLDGENFIQKLKESLIELSENTEKNISFEAPVKKTPSATSTGEVNNLGIKELIGRGTSRFRGSIASRVYNIDLAASRLNGILISPGDTFSFNDALGDISKFTGYQEAYVIRGGKTVLGDGGGVCQVSTTLFRAALNAGLPITERQAHAYRVGYYEQDSAPGLDATVYGPSPDLKIKNDTPFHILIQTSINKKTSSLVFELYGTNDGRVASVSKPVSVNVVPAGEDVYIDDPSLPTGTVKQTEYKANGAKVTFNYLVKRDGESIYKKTFTSNYRPWPAVYLRGTGAAN